MDFKENVIEWITGDDTITLTLTQQRFITKVRKLCKEHAESCSILAENSDGSILARLPLKSLKLNIITSSLNEEQIEASRKRMKMLNEKRKSEE